MEKEMGKECKFGKMARFTKGIGRMAKQMERDVSSMQTVISRKAYSKMTSCTALVSSRRKMDRVMMENGSMIHRMDKERSTGLTVPSSKAHIKMARRKVKGDS